MNWMLATWLATILFGVYPIFGNRAGQIHGEKINFILDGAIMFLMCVILSLFYRSDFQKITKVSLGYSLFMGLSSMGFILMLYAWRVAPGKMPIIQIIISFAPIITAIMSTKMDHTVLSPHQWFGAFGAILCVCLVTLNKTQFESILQFFKP